MRVRLLIDIETTHPVETVGGLCIAQPPCTVTFGPVELPPLYGRLMGAIAVEGAPASATDATEDTEGTRT